MPESHDLNRANVLSGPIMIRRPPYTSPSLASLLALSLLAGCSSNATKKDERDPLENWNRGVQNFNDKLDDYVMKPVATGYKKVTPSVVDQGVTNFYNNVEDITVIGNDLLQFKLLQTGKDIGRFFVNSTVGLAGFVDVASKMNLAKHNEDFDQTLAVWGIPSGPYMVLPLLGPSTPRGRSAAGRSVAVVGGGSCRCNPRTAGAGIRGAAGRFQSGGRKAGRGHRSDVRGDGADPVGSHRDQRGGG